MGEPLTDADLTRIARDADSVQREQWRLRSGISKPRASAARYAAIARAVREAVEKERAAPVDAEALYEAHRAGAEHWLAPWSKLGRVARMKWESLARTGITQEPSPAEPTAAHRRRIYVAGPISNGGTASLDEQDENLAAAIRAADRLLRAGFAPFVPHLCCAWHEQYPHTHAEWLDFDFQWLSVCDALVRLRGESKGASMEVAWCREHGVPVYYSVEEVIRGLGGAAAEPTVHTGPTSATAPPVTEDGAAGGADPPIETGLYHPLRVEWRDTRDGTTWLLMDAVDQVLVDGGNDTVLLALATAANESAAASTLRARAERAEVALAQVRALAVRWRTQRLDGEHHDSRESERCLCADEVEAIVGKGNGA